MRVGGAQHDHGQGDGKQPPLSQPLKAGPKPHCRERGEQQAQRSEEHTSELQSLMRISYAVFCLKKKKTHTLTNPDNSLKQLITTYTNTFSINNNKTITHTKLPQT